MTELLSAQQMRDIEKAAMDSGEVTGLELMERAGQGVVDAILAEWPELQKGKRRAVVLCGPGNNGGDGFVIARLLAEREWAVRVHLFGDPAKLPPDAKVNHDRWAADHGVLPMTADDVFAGERPDVFVDAVFGIGLTRPLPEHVARALDVKGMKAWKRAHEIRRVAVDCPSGLDLDRGVVPSDMEPDDPEADPWPRTLNVAELTVTFHTPKLGHYLGLGPGLCRKLAIVDIGVGPFVPERAMVGMHPDSERVRLVAPTFAGTPLRPRMWPMSHIAKSRGMGHKFDHGHVIVFAGGVGRGGAARMAARAALRAGAGLVTVLCPPAAVIENACHLDAVMLRALAKDQALAEVIDERVSGFVVGPGMGVSEWTRKRVIEVLGRRAEGAAHRDPIVVLDADALTSFEGDPQTLFAHTHGRTVLTPHEGEFGRLFPDLSGPARAGMSKIHAVRAAADRAGCIVLVKGPDTVIAAPGGGASVHAAAYGREVPWLATAGAGDVLAGLIAGLGAPHTSSEAYAMTEIAAWLHVEAARRFGPGLIAEDLPEQLPGLFAELSG
ncbi:NAD(P)H-hydrate dehydratase [Marimonas sp. MJW-29]|uniref:Bifunctional NAD(P)H-hydrate repair enzyme n=1 Tax=Sulfitobacter sediminis TaxID=3234186 RepID=A0ABV3RSK6_9RHOB